MTTKTEVEFKVTADTSQAQGALGGFKQETSGATSAAALLDKRIEQMTKDMETLSDAIVSGKGNTQAYKNELQRLERQFASMSDEVGTTTEKIVSFKSSAAAGAKSTRNVGQAALEASRAFEDLQYGVGGVINNIPSLVMSLGGSAGLTAAISLAAVGLNQLYKNFIAVPDAAEKAADVAVDRMKEIGDQIKDINDSIIDLVEGAGRAAERAQGARIVSAQKAVDAAMNAFPGGKQQFEQWMKLTSEGKNLDLLPTREWGPGKNQNFFSEEQFKGAMDAVKTLQGETDLLMAMQRQRLYEEEKADEKSAERANRKAAREIESEAKKDARLQQQLAKQNRQEQAALDKIEEQNRAHESKLLEDDKKAAEKARKEKERDEERARKAQERSAERYMKVVNKSIARAAKERRDAEEKAEREHKEKLKSIDREYWDSVAGMAQNATSNLISVGQEYIDAKIKGEKNAEVAAAASFLKTTGNQLVASGTAQVWKGIMYAADPLTAAVAPGVIGTGAAAIAAGVAMGAAGSAVAHAGAGGAIGSPAPDRAGRRDRGAAPERSMSDSGGPLVVNISYGVGGPLPEDTAREVADVMAVAGRR